MEEKRAFQQSLRLFVLDQQASKLAKCKFDLYWTMYDSRTKLFAKKIYAELDHVDVRALSFWESQQPNEKRSDNPFDELF